MISGPPAAGKSTLAEALLAEFPLAFHLKVDDLRISVTSGLADSVPWTEETERQFQLAEQASSAVARVYAEAGFAVAFDHCRNLPRLQQVVDDHLDGLVVVKVCLLPELTTNLRRSHTRTNKSFDPHMLDETITYVNGSYGKTAPAGWHVIDNTSLTVEETVRLVLSYAPDTD